MTQLTHPYYLARLIPISLLLGAALIAATGYVTVPAGTYTIIGLLLALAITDLLHHYSPDTPDPVYEAEIADEDHIDLDTDSVIYDFQNNLR